MVRFILPVKDLRRSKSRLQVVDRVELVTAMLLDTVAAILTADAGPVVVVSPDERVRSALSGLAVSFLHSDAPLNDAISAALVPGTCAAVLPDLPALTAEDVAALIAARRGHVPDAAGTGTSMAIADDLQPAFGPDSAAAFTSLGLPPVLTGPGARCDVDDLDDLDAAIALGVGRNTQRWLEQHGSGPHPVGRTR